MCLIGKLIDLGVRRFLIPWIINSGLPVSAGIPQGTKLGPILFLIMVNNLRIVSPNTRMWKYVDDISTSENLSRDSISTNQSTLNSVQVRASDNWMKLDIKKCKELRVCFLTSESPQLLPLSIYGHALETVRSHKVLGLTIQNNLKWDEHIFSTVSKASKLLHILCVLRRGGVPVVDLTTMHICCMR